MPSVESNLKGVVGSSPNGIPLSQLEKEYFNLTHSVLDYRALGWKTLRQFLQSIPEVVELENVGGQMIVKISIGRNDSRCLQNLVNLVSNTAQKKINKNKNNKCTSLRLGGHLETLRISVPNDLCLGTWEGASASKSQGGKQGAVKNNLRDGTNLEAACEWLVCPSIALDPFQGEVTVLAVLRSHALVAGPDHRLPGKLLSAGPAASMFPGDMLLWQPPLGGGESPDLVDLGSAFLVVYLRRKGRGVLVRVLGLPVVLEAALGEVRAVPRGQGASLAGLLSSRSLSLVPLAFLPPDTDLPGPYAGSWKARPASEEGGLVLEAGGGLSLNLAVLGSLEAQAALCLEEGPRHAFLAHLAATVARTLVAMGPVHERLAATDPDLHQECAPLSLVYSASECEGRLLVGPESLLTGRDDPGRSLLRLEAREEAGEPFLVALDRPDLPKVPMGRRFPLAGAFLVQRRPPGGHEDLLQTRAALLCQLPALGTLADRLGLPPLPI